MATKKQGTKPAPRGEHGADAAGQQSGKRGRTGGGGSQRTTSKG